MREPAPPPQPTQPSPPTTTTTTTLQTQNPPPREATARTPLTHPTRGDRGVPASFSGQESIIASLTKIDPDPRVLRGSSRGALLSRGEVGMMGRIWIRRGRGPWLRFRMNPRGRVPMQMRVVVRERDILVMLPVVTVTMQLPMPMPTAAIGIAVAPHRVRNHPVGIETLRPKMQAKKKEATTTTGPNPLLKKAPPPAPDHNYNHNHNPNLHNHNHQPITHPKKIKQS